MPVKVQSIAKTEAQNVWIYAQDEHTGAVVTITSATFEVFDTDGVSVQDSASATLVDNGTATPDVKGLVDARESGFVAGEYYEVLFTVNIDSESEVLTLARHIKCVEKKS